MSRKTKKRKGEKYDAYLVTDLAPMQEFMLSLLGSRTENEAVCNFDIDTAGLDAYLEKKNSENPEFKYTFFHVMCAAMGRTIADRPRMNWFIRKGHFYERKKISLTAVAKKKKADGAEEGIIVMNYDKSSKESPIDQMHNSICRQVNTIRTNSDDQHDDTNRIMGNLVRLPRFIYNIVTKMILLLDRNGNLPKELADASPYSTTCFISNLGSIGMNANYHHLSNFGSNSFFAIIGKKEIKPRFNADGSYEMRTVLPFSFTIDERIGDGVYFAKTIRLFKAYMMRPELLETPADQSIDMDSIIAEMGL